MLYRGRWPAWIEPCKGVFLAIGYALAFLLARRFSDDQWFLPAGLRVAALLLLPCRYWGYVLAGEVSALLYLRIPYVGEQGLAWVVITSLTYTTWVFPLVNKVKQSIEKKSTDPIIGVLVLAAAISIVGTCLSSALMYLLSQHAPSRDAITLAHMLKYSLGDYLGILLFAPLVILWQRGHLDTVHFRSLWRDTAGAAIIVFVIAAVVIQLPASEAELKQGLRFVMILPAAAITFQQGWRGAAVGAVMSNLGIGLTISSTGLLGNYDSYAYLVQEILAITATMLLALGVAITRPYRKSVASGLAVQETLGLARLSFSSSERHLRDQALRIADIQEQIEQSRSTIIRSLREHRHHAAVMEVMRSGVVQSRLFDSHINAVYPIGIESDGLYKTLGSPTLSEMWGRGIEVRRSLRGSPQGLSVELQLVAYRCICDAVAILTEGNPERVSIRAKTSANLHGARIAICIEAINPEQRPSSESSRLAGVDLDSRVRAHGGTLHQSGDRISFMLREQPATDRYGAAFRTSQVMPLAST